MTTDQVNLFEPFCSWYFTDKPVTVLTITITNAVCLPSYTAYLVTGELSGS